MLWLHSVFLHTLLFPPIVIETQDHTAHVFLCYSNRPCRWTLSTANVFQTGTKTLWAPINLRYQVGLMVSSKLQNWNTRTAPQNCWQLVSQRNWHQKTPFSHRKRVEQNVFCHRMMLGMAWPKCCERINIISNDCQDCGRMLNPTDLHLQKQLRAASSMIASPASICGRRSNFKTHYCFSHCKSKHYCFAMQFVSAKNKNIYVPENVIMFEVGSEKTPQLHVSHCKSEHGSATHLAKANRTTKTWKCLKRQIC